ncbi:MAG: Protoporphyrinogen IX oxidase, aerobic, HemY [uncultured Truepera sp.]|uniref:Coproporphyrinogen III oxidase n=1 Tax=uncultured Truepera sp. TaxID=543023 RepID=A0A6J4VAG3_9DEIN|nr:MAG: Protoporphyrinogen IX oxidase, aerobic, HemY [uncultured Truepera sp.]
MVKRVVIIGGGLAGLSTAFFLQQVRPDLHLSILEKEHETGGKVRSTLRGGYTVDWAANGFLPSVPDTLELARALGLELQEAAEVAKHRFLYRDGALHKLPASPPAFLASNLLLPSEKLRAAAEPLLGRAHDGEESVYDFVARHFGQGVAEAFAGPFVLGITAGDAKKLSLDALFPRFRALEQAHGSLVRALIKQRAVKKNANPDRPKRLTSFHGGSGRLVRALEEAFRGRLERGVSVEAVRPLARGFEMTRRNGEPLRADAVVLATPSFVAAQLVKPFSPVAAEALSEIRYADVQVFGLGYGRVDVPNALDGFGFLVPRGEGVRVLGVLYSSSIFPDQAPDGRVLLRVIAGGSVDPEFAALTPEEALRAVRRDLRVTMGIVAEPELVEHVPWPQGIPQYELGHLARVARAETALAGHPVLLTGNAYRGVGVNDTVRDARRTAEALSERLGAYE